MQVIEILCAMVVQLFSKFTLFYCWRWKNFCTLRKCVQFTFAREYGHTQRVFHQLLLCQHNREVSRTEHLALEKETTEGDGHGSGTMATVQTHYTAERGGGVKLTTDSRILKILWLWSLLYKRVIRDVMLQFWNHIHTMACITFICSLASTPPYECS